MSFRTGNPSGPVFAAFLTLVWLLAACQGPKPAPTVLELMMPAEQVPGVTRVEQKSVVIDRGSDTDGNLDVDALRRQRATGSAYYKYWTDTDPRGAYKLKINVYVDAEALAAGWARRYPEAALRGSVPVDHGAGGFSFPGQVVVFRLGNAMFEISSSGGADDLDGFVTRYVSYARTLFE